MPRDTFQIKNFNLGIISALDEKDIPPESASDSLNIDGDVAQGILQGIPTDTEFTTNGSASIGNIRVAQFLEKNSTYDLIYHDSSANKIRAIVDFYSSKYSRDLVTTNVSDDTVIIANNKEVHIGTGNGSANVSKWVGYCGFGQFGNGTSWSITDATNASPIVVTAAGHSLKDGNLVSIASVAGNTAANGVWIVASSDPAAGTFALTGSTGNGAYTSGGTATQHLCIENAKCNNRTQLITPADGYFSFTAAETAGSAPQYFVTSKTYYWALSYIYDGYQESPLITENTSYGYPTPFDSEGYVSDTPSSNSEYYTITITAHGADDNEDSFNKRVTGINVYRAESDGTTSGGRGLYRLVAYVDINDTGWTAGSGNKTIAVIDYGLLGKVGTATATNYGQATYEQNSGIAENIANTMVGYKLAAKGEGYLFVGGCYKQELPDADRYIFRSKELRYDMFNWIEDFVVLPEPVQAMAYFNGRLFAFSYNNVYRIHPELYIEDVFNGAGAFGQRSVLVTEYGMFFANKNGAYWMDNSGSIDIISKPIQRSLTSGRSWRTLKFDVLFDIPIAYSSIKKYVLFFNSFSANDYLGAWAFNVTTRRWDFWSFAGSYVVTSNSGSFTDRDGNVYFSINANTYQLMTNSGKQAWEWYSQDMTFGESRQDKALNKIKVDTTGTVTITYGTNGGAVSTSYTNEAYINSYVKSLRVKLNAASGANSVDSLEVIFRRLIGKR